MDKDFRGFNHGTAIIALAPYPGKVIVEALPIEIHLKEDGTLDSKPCFAIVMQLPTDDKIVGQISMHMLNEALNEVGYQILKL